jgi:hypothetical protein
MSALETSVPEVTTPPAAAPAATPPAATLPPATAKPLTAAAEIPADADPVEAIEHWVKEGDTGEDAVAVNNMLVALGKIEMVNGDAPQTFGEESADAIEEIQSQYAVNIKTLEVVLWDADSKKNPDVYKLDEDRIAGQYTRYVLKHLLVKEGLLDDDEVGIPREALVRTLSNKRLVGAGLEKAAGDKAAATTISSTMLSSSGVTPVADNVPAAPVAPAAQPSAPTTPDTTQDKANKLDLAVIAAVTQSKNLTIKQKNDLNGIVDQTKLTVTRDGNGYIVAIPKAIVKEEDKAFAVAEEILVKINSLDDTSKELEITSDQELNSDKTLGLYSIKESTDTDQNPE